MLDESKSGTWNDQECQNFERQGGKAKKNPIMVKNLLCKEFNIRETSSEAWLTFEQANNPEKYDLEVLKPRYGIGGVDLSSTTDLTAAKVLFKVPNDEHIYVISMYWIPEELVDKHVTEDKVPYDIWIEKDMCGRVQETRFPTEM